MLGGYIILMVMNKGKYLLIGGVSIGLLALFIVPRLLNGRLINESGLPCLTPNLPLVTHIHPRLTVVVDGLDQTMPPNIGLGACELPLHTHDTTGVIHVEAQVARDYTLGEFLKVWGQPINREGYQLEMTVDGKPSQELDKLVLRDAQEIVLTYVKN